MILPTIRASLSRSDAHQLVRLLGREDPELGEAAQLRLEENGIGSLLDDRDVRLFRATAKAVKKAETDSVRRIAFPPEVFAFSTLRRNQSIVSPMASR